MYKKIKSWLFREDLNLNKFWWHRLIKVIFLSLFFLTVTGSYIALVVSPDEMFLSKHNISVNNTLYEFTKNYTGKENDNTIPKFFKQKGFFGALVNNRIKYISEYSLGESFCLKTPEKYQDEIINVFYTDYINKLDYRETADTFENFSDVLKPGIFKDASRKCFLYDMRLSDELKGNVDSSNIINYSPSAIFYIEATVIVPLLALFYFVLFALIYYRLIIYIVYGNKK